MQQFTTKVGPEGRTETFSHLSRTAAQFQAVKAITESKDFGYVCGSDPFTKEVGKYKGSFCFMYFTIDGKLHFAWITPSGKVKE